MRSIWALQDAKNRFSAVVDRECQVEPKKRTFDEVFLGGPKIDGGLAIRRDKSSLHQMELA